MSDVTKPARRRAKSATDDAKSTVDEQATGATDQVREATGDGNGANGSRTITSELKDTVREAAIEVLRPVMRQATTEAAKFAVKRGPGLVKDKVAPKIQDAGGAGALAKGVASKGGGVAGAVGGIASSIGDKLPGGGGKKGESPSGTGRGRRLPVQEFIDVGVDLQTAYDQFTQFEDWPQFMHRVERIEQRDDTTLMWHENIWGVRRSWEAEITDQVPCERIVWRSTSGPQSIGVVTFHSLSDNLTRIAITMDFQPKGLFEKTSSGTRISRRALRSDLMRFKAFIELRDEATGGWRGMIEDGEVVDEQDEQDERSSEERDDEPQASEESDEEFEDEEPEASEEEDYEDEEPEALEDEEPADEEPADEESEDEEPEDEEPEASEEEDYEDEEPEASEEEDEPEASEEPDDEEPEPKPKPRRRRRAAAASGRSRS
jgi:uncharacterized membrane protein